MMCTSGKLLTNVRNLMTFFLKINCNVKALLREFRKIYFFFTEKKYFEGIRNCCFRQKCNKFYIPYTFFLSNELGINNWIVLSSIDLYILTVM